MRRDYQSPTILVEHDKGHGRTTIYMKQLMRRKTQVVTVLLLNSIGNKQGLLLLVHSPP
ncbi:TPA: hypothetical protein QCX54_004166 [Bacillus toyonensis]|nr:hypothetical protein [Bacillus toyonensis]